MTAYVENNRVVKITDSKLSSEFTSGCPVGYQAYRSLYARDRLLFPLLRSGPKGSGQFKKISWDRALDLVAEKMITLKTKQGAESLLKLGGSGSVRGALHNTNSLTKRFLGLWGDYTDAIGGYSSQAASFVTPYMLGTKQCGIDPETLFQSERIVLLGSNVCDTRFGSKLENILRKVKQSGTPVVVVDPRKTRTVKQLGTDWIKIYPGTDSAFLISVIYVLADKALIDRKFIDTYTKGFDRFLSYVMGKKDGVPKTPCWAEKICGVPASVIQKFALDYASASSAAIIPGLSIQRTMGGEDAYRMSIALQAVTGNIGKQGGSSGGRVHSALPHPQCKAIKPIKDSSVSIDIYSYPDAVLGGKKEGYPSDISMIYAVGSNLLSQGSDIRKNIQAFEKVAFSICHECFLTPTAGYSDVIFPASHFLERDDIVFTVDNWLLYSNKAVDPPPGVKHDYEIFCELSKRLGFYEKFSENRSDTEWLDYFIEDSDIADPKTFKQTGILEGKECDRVAFSDFIKAPDKHPLHTPSGKIEILSEAYGKTGFPPYPSVTVMEREKIHPLFLITPHPRFRIHSQTVNIPWFKKFDKQRLYIHPHNAEERLIQNGQAVTVKNKIGSLTVIAYITEDIMEGVVSLYEGCWPDIRKGIDTGGSVNFLTSTKPTLPSHGARTHSVLVEVETVSSNCPL